MLSLNDPDILRQVNQLRQTDNVTSWFYLAREYLFLGVVLGGAIAFYYYLEGAELSWLWATPVTLLAIVLIRAGQQFPFRCLEFRICFGFRYSNFGFTQQTCIAKKPAAA